MAFDSFLQFVTPGSNAPAVVGESSDPAFQSPVEAIEISEFSFGGENTLSIGSATSGAGAGKATFKEFTVKKLVDTASPSLLVMLATGSHYKVVQLSLRKSGAAGAAGSGSPYLAFRFGLFAVKSIEWAGSTGDDSPTENVVFEFGEIEMWYCKQNADGSLNAAIDKQWSRLTNSPTCTQITGTYSPPAAGS